MKTEETNEKTLDRLEPMLNGAVNRILALQDEIDELRALLDTAIHLAAKKSYPKGEVVSAEKLLAMKEISEPLSIKLSENERLVLELYHLIFPGDIFITQHYFDVWVKIDATTVVKFAYDMSSIEVKVLEDLN